MSIIPIKTVPDPILTRKCEKITALDDNMEKIIKDLIDTLDKATEPEGAGISAPQIGYSQQVCVVRDFTSEEAPEDLVLINPKIISTSKETETDWEGCLSVPEVYGKVQRPKKIKLKALNRNGEGIKVKASGYLARVLQHEIDHLNGILFTSKVSGSTITGEEFETL